MVGFLYDVSCLHIIISSSSLSHGSLDHCPKVRMHLRKVGHSPFSNCWFSRFQMSSNVRSQPLPFLGSQNVVPKVGHLRKVVLISRIVALNVTRELEGRLNSRRTFMGSVERIWEIIWSSVLGKQAHWPIPGVRRSFHIPLRCIHWNLGVVCSKTVSMGVDVREKTPLKHLVWRRFNARNHVCRSKSHLFNFRKVILWVSIKSESTHLNEWEFLLGPNLGQVEWIPTEFFSLFKRHDLKMHGPRWELSILNSIIQVSNGVVRVIP